MVDAEKITKNKEYFEVYLADLCPEGKHYCLLHVDVRYKFQEKAWINGIDKSEFDDSLWLRREKATPVYPVVTDSLGEVLTTTYVICNQNLSHHSRRLCAETMLYC